MTLNGQHIVSDVIALCGGRNVFADLPPLVPQLSTESVVAANPQVMLSAREDPDSGPVLKRGANDPALRRAGCATRRSKPCAGTGSTRCRAISSPARVRASSTGRAACVRALDEVRAERRARP